MATQRSESCARTASSTRKKSARSRSSMFTNTTRDNSYSSARFQTRLVLTSTPITALTTTSAPSTTRSAAYVSAWKPASPGQSTRLILRSCQSMWTSAPESDIWRLCSSSSQSAAVVPASIVPSLFVFPAWKRIASASEVFPTPRWPTTAMLRILPGSVTAGTTSPSWLSVSVETDSISGAFEGGAGRRAGQTGLEAEDRLRVQLRDARLGDAEHLADLAEGQLLVVVERDDELLALREARDRVGDRLAHLGVRERALRVGRVGVLDRVDQGDLIALARDGPQLVERCDRGARDVGEAVLELLDRDPDLLRDLLVVRRTPGLRLEGCDRALDLASARADRARHPVHGAQLVDDRALDARDRIRLELDVAVGLVALDRADQPEQPVRDEIALVDVCGQTATEAAGDVLHERRIREDQPVADPLGAGLQVLQPQCLSLVGPAHETRIRGGPAFSSATERRDARRAEPQSERERRNRDDPPPRFAACTDERGGRDDEQTDGQSAEKQAESAPLHARTLFLRQRSLPLPLVLAVALALLLLEQLVGALLPLLLRPVHVFLRLIGHAGKMPKTEGYNLHR